MNICLLAMTKELCRRFFEDFAHDPDMFTDLSRFKPYSYSPEQADAHWQRQRDLNRIHLAIMLDEEPIGEILLKNIDHRKGCCTIGIHLQNDSRKNQGYGSEAELQALEYAFSNMGLNTVYADALIQNRRSRHVLNKVGFRETHRDETFVYYICEKQSWKRPKSDSLI